MSDIVKRGARFPDIDPKTWEHPADRAALTSLRQLKGLDTLVKAVFGQVSDRSVRLFFLASSVRTSPRQFPRVNAFMKDICSTFDWPTIPEVFVTNSPFFNAMAIGVDQPFIVLNSGTVKSLGDQELKAVLAHELAHIMSGHMLYKTLIILLVILADILTPVMRLVIQPILMALYEWDRKSELSSDRAGLLAVQEPSPCFDLLMKTAGGDDLSQMNIGDFFEQAAEYEAAGTLVDSIHKLFNTLYQTHPLAVTRLAELRSWAVAGPYQAILDGIYLKRTVRHDHADEDVKTAFESYQREFESSSDPLSQAAAHVGKAAQALGAGFEQTAQDLKESTDKVFADISAKLGEIFGKGKEGG